MGRKGNEILKTKKRISVHVLNHTQCGTGGREAVKGLDSKEVKQRAEAVSAMQRTVQVETTGKTQHAVPDRPRFLDQPVGQPYRRLMLMKLGSENAPGADAALELSLPERSRTWFAPEASVSGRDDFLGQIQVKTFRAVETRPCLGAVSSDGSFAVAACRR